MNCPYCNFEVKDGMKFCPKCGSEIPFKKVCPNCGNEIVATNMRFCNNCGAQLQLNNEQLNIKPMHITKVRKWFGIFAVIVICYLGLSYFTSNKSSQEDINYQSQGKDYNLIEQETNINPPDWIQGDWAVTTPYGSFGVKFQGKKMWVVDFDGTMRSGSYRYDADENTIYPDFESSYYELDNINHRIAAGNGYYFHRI